MRALMKNWSKEWINEWEERAAIMEFDGGLSRKDAEREAYWDIKKQHDR